MASMSGTLSSLLALWCISSLFFIWISTKSLEPDDRGQSSFMRAALDSFGLPQVSVSFEMKDQEVSSLSFQTKNDAPQKLVNNPPPNNFANNTLNGGSKSSIDKPEFVIHVG
jgi:hypothetical protein